MTHEPTPTLGELESEVMRCLWERAEPMAVRDVLDALNRDRALAYTTVMTVLDNVYRKGMVTREREGRSYIYSVAFSQNVYAGKLIADAAEQAGHRVGALLHFVNGLSSAELRELRAALEGSEQAPNQAQPGGSKPS
ncbi:MAG: putative transcriptional regulator [Actinomycetes bacterium]|jgi:predicted transcriptional regulator